MEGIKLNQGMDITVEDADSLLKFPKGGGMFISTWVALFVFGFSCFVCAVQALRAYLMERKKRR